MIVLLVTFILLILILIKYSLLIRAVFRRTFYLFMKNITAIFNIFVGIDFESFVNLKPEHIKEAIPNVIHRIMFENRFNNFLKSYEGAVSGKETNTQLITLIDFDRVDEPVFDENFDLINVASTSSSAISKSIPDLQKSLKKATIIKTIQVLLCTSFIANPQ